MTRIPKLSIFMPTHYAGPQHYAAIFSAMRATAHKEVEFVIADNSGNDKKYEFLRQFESERVRLLKGPIAKNHHFALQQTRGEFVLCVGDDDMLLPSGLDAILQSLQAPNTAGAMGVYGRDLGTAYEFTKFPLINSASVPERINGLLGTIPTGNPLFYCVVKREIALATYQLYFSLPNWQSFHDHIASLLPVLLGPIQTTNQPYFIYNYKNWHGTQARMESELHHIKSQELPPSITLLQRLILAVEGYFLITSRQIQARQDSSRNNAAAAWFSNWMHYWVASLSDGYLDHPQVKDCIHRPFSVALVAKHRNSTQFNPDELLDDIAAYYERINGSGQRYKAFWKELDVLAPYALSCQ